MVGKSAEKEFPLDERNQEDNNLNNSGSDNEETLEAESEPKHSLFLSKDCDELNKQFFQLQTPRDIANLLETSYKNLIYHLYVVSPSFKYTTFQIPKKSGESRVISAPATALKIIQRKLSQVLYSIYRTKPSVYGFIPGRNIVDNAQIHVKKRYVLNIDLKEFFPSINFGRVRGMFMGKPYNLNPGVATVLAQICCHDNQLPQGAPSSPIVTNMICGKMDSQFQQLAKKYKCIYTRYGDDITFSTTLSKFPNALAYKIENGNKVVLGQGIIQIIHENGFKPNEKKIRLQPKNSHQEVTGLTVNKFPNVNRKYIREIRVILHSWSIFGLRAAESKYFDKNNKWRRPQKGKETPSLKQILRGKIEFVAQVKGKDNPTYLKYLGQYYDLLKKEKNEKAEDSVDE